MLTSTWPSAVALGIALLLAVSAAGGLVSRHTEAEDVAAIRLTPNGLSTGRVPDEVTDQPSDPSDGDLDGAVVEPTGTNDGGGAGTNDGDSADTGAPPVTGDRIDKPGADRSPGGGGANRRADDDREDDRGGNRGSDRSQSRDNDDDDGEDDDGDEDDDDVDEDDD